MAYEQRIGMVGKDYADPVRARAGSIEYGRFLCEELAKGTDRKVLEGKSARAGNVSREEFTVQLDTAIEFLCPEHA